MLTILNSNIRTLGGLYSLNDLHKASGSEYRHKPNRFIRLGQTQELIAEINRCPDVGTAIESKRGGANQGTWVCKELVYAYAMWISAKFSLMVIRAFDAMAIESMRQRESYYEECNRVMLLHKIEKEKASSAGRALNEWGKKKKPEIENKIAQLHFESQYTLLN